MSGIKRSLKSDFFFRKIRPVFAVWNAAVDNNARYADLLFFFNRGALGTVAVCSLVTIETNHQNPSAILINANDTENSNHK